MAIDISSTYPGRVNPPDSDYPFGSARNIVTPGDGMATPLEKTWVNDLFGFQQALLGETGTSPSGSPETANASQYLESIKLIAAVPVDGVVDLVAIPDGARGATSTRGFLYDAATNNPKGGGVFVWVADADKADADGVTIIDPDNIGTFDGTEPTVANYLATQGTGAGTGCWVQVTAYPNGLQTAGDMSGIPEHREIGDELMNFTRAAQSGPPSVAPLNVGQTYVDMAAGNVYVAVGTVDLTSWKVV